MLDELAAILAADFGPQSDAAAFAEVLYHRCYARALNDPDVPASAANEDLTPLLIAANCSREGWDLGWRVDQALDDGRVLASKSGAARVFRAGQYLTLRGPGPRPEAGDPVRVFAPAGSDAIQQDFYYAFGETVCEFDEFEDLFRYYWNIAPEGAPRLTAAVTRDFNRFQVPFRFKCGRTPAMCRRRDAAVLYIHRRYESIASLLLERVHAEIADFLRDSVPLFTQRVAPGLGFAEDPGGESFGQSRSRILADAMLAARTLQELRRQFAQRGLSLDEPWRNPRP